MRNKFRCFGFDLTCINTNKFLDEIKKMKILLESLYIHKHQSTLDIGRMYKICPSSIRDLLKLFGIVLRSISSANKVAIKTKGILPQNNYKHKTYWHIMSNGNKVLLRSKFELKVAKLLDKQGIEYEVESIRVPYKLNGITRVYIPDFYIPKKNLIIEVKGTLFYNHVCKLKELATKKLGYRYKFILAKNLSDISFMWVDRASERGQLQPAY